MRHRVAGKKLNRSTSHRTALRRNLIKQLFRHEQIRTTRAKAEAVQGQSEKMITIAKRGIASGDPDKELHARRRVASKLNDPEIVRKLFDELAPRYMDRPGGYTRKLKLGWRKGDAAELVLLALVQEEL